MDVLLEVALVRVVEPDENADVAGPVLEDNEEADVVDPDDVVLALLSKCQNPLIEDETNATYTPDDVEPEAVADPLPELLPSSTFEFTQLESELLEIVTAEENTWVPVLSLSARVLKSQTSQIRRKSNKIIDIHASSRSDINIPSDRSTLIRWP